MTRKIANKNYEAVRAVPSRSMSLDVVALRYKRERDSLHRQRDVFSNGTCTMHSNGRNITAETLASIIKNIDELDGLIARSEAAGWESGG